MIDAGTTVKWQSSEYFGSKLLPVDSLAAYMGELAICRSAGTLHAEGGPCPIIAVFRPDVGLGALLHVNGGDAEIDGDNHEELIDQLVEMEGEIVEAACHVFLDELPMAGLQDGENEKEQREARKAYSGRIKDYLESKGMQDVTVVFDGEGKAVELADTIAGTVTSKGDDDEVAFSHTYQPVEAAAPPADPAPAEGPKADEEEPE